MKDRVTANMLAQMWGVTPRRINQLCSAGAIEGAIKKGGAWQIPADTPKPDAVRDKAPAFQATTEKLPCPVGITSYREIASECYYVDKTLIIKDLIDDHSKVTLFTRPRRFGKTLCMDMLKTFFEKCDEDTAVYFRNRDIWRCAEVYRRYQGRYPVIFISFKDAHQDTWQAVREGIAITVGQEFARHHCLEDSPALSAADQDFYRRAVLCQLSEAELQRSLGRLSDMLSRVYSEKTVVLIDEYDTPIEQGYSCGFFSEAANFMRNLFSPVLKDNEKLEFAVLTGILRIAKESLFSGLNNIYVNTLLDERYSAYFGFTEQEIIKMASYYGEEKSIGQIREWYDGYLFGKTEMYNPWSVVCYFNNLCIPKAFWSRTGSSEIILELVRKGRPEISEKLVQLMEGEAIQALIETDIVYPEIGVSDDSIFSFLLMAGYLRINGYVSSIDDTPVCTLVIPNKEVRSVFKKEIVSHLGSLINYPAIRALQLALVNGDGTRVEKSLETFLSATVSFYDTSKENFYHGLMLGLLAVMSDSYRVLSNRESGDGRPDIMMTPLTATLPAIIIELKGANDSQAPDLASVALTAIRQIKEKNYASGIDEDLPVIMYGIAFSGKSVSVASERA